MKKAFEKIKERLEEESKFAVSLLNGKTDRYVAGVCDANKKAIKVVSEVEAEYGNGWIPCSERMPEAYETGKVWITVSYPSGRCTLKASWNGWCFEWMNGKYVDTKTHKIVAWKPYHGPEPYNPEKGE